MKRNELLKARKELISCLRTCPDCGGTGKRSDNQEDACPYCGGYGRILTGGFMEAVIDIEEEL